MQLVFEPNEVRDWAHLSQDFNPIHFDDTIARRMGLEGVVVHGMLPLMHIKHHLGERMDAHAAEQWKTIRCKFRQPVSERRAHRLELKDKASTCRFSLRRESDGVEMIGGAALAEEIEGLRMPASASFGIAPEVIREKTAMFRQVFPEFDRAWLLLDAIVFSQFLSHEIPFELVRQTEGFDLAKGQRELMHRALTVQTSHTVSVSPNLWLLPIDAFDPDGQIECRVLPPITASGGAESIAGACQIDVFLDGEFVMQSEVGVYLRFEGKNSIHEEIMSNKEDILAQLIELIGDMKDCEEAAVHAGASFNDLELDSLDFVEVQVAVKKRYQVNLLPDLFTNGAITNVGQLADFIAAEAAVVAA